MGKRHWGDSDEDDEPAQPPPPKRKQTSTGISSDESEKKEQISKTAVVAAHPSVVSPPKKKKSKYKVLSSDEDEKPVKEQIKPRVVAARVKKEPAVKVETAVVKGENDDVKPRAVAAPRAVVKAEKKPVVKVVKNEEAAEDVKPRDVKKHRVKKEVDVKPRRKNNAFERTDAEAVQLATEAIRVHSTLTAAEKRLRELKEMLNRLADQVRQREQEARQREQEVRQRDLQGAAVALAAADAVAEPRRSSPPPAVVAAGAAATVVSRLVTTRGAVSCEMVELAAPLRNSAPKRRSVCVETVTHNETLRFVSGLGCLAWLGATELPAFFVACKWASVMSENAYLWRQAHQVHTARELSRGAGAAVVAEEEPQRTDEVLLEHNPLAEIAEEEEEEGEEEQEEKPRRIGEVLFGGFDEVTKTRSRRAELVAHETTEASTPGDRDVELRHTAGFAREPVVNILAFETQDPGLKQELETLIGYPLVAEPGTVALCYYVGENVLLSKERQASVRITAHSKLENGAVDKDQDLGRLAAASAEVAKEAGKELVGLKARLRQLAQGRKTVIGCGEGKVLISEAVAAKYGPKIDVDLDRWRSLDPSVQKRCLDSGIFELKGGRAPSTSLHTNAKIGTRQRRKTPMLRASRTDDACQYEFSHA